MLLAILAHSERMVALSYIINRRLRERPVLASVIYGRAKITP